MFLLFLHSAKIPKTQFLRAANSSASASEDDDDVFLRRPPHLPPLHDPAPINNHQTALRREEDEDDDEEEMEREIEKMKREQVEMEKEMQGMTKRLETTERRPDQMMSFLYRVADDPEILPKMMVERDRRTRRRQICAHRPEYEKRRRLISATPRSSSLGTASNSGEEEGRTSVSVTSSSPEVELMCQIAGHGISVDGEVSTEAVAGYVGFVWDAPSVEAPVPPYPFSLFGGGF